MPQSGERRAPTAPGQRAGYGFGTFKGVFMPSILTILGVIMFLRLPWVLGSVGLANTLLIVTMSVGVTLLTGLSIAAMATNMRVGGGGAYYMISRTLGLEVGAAVGLPLFLAQALGVAFYVAGFTETVVGYFPLLSPDVVGVATLLILTVLAYVSADLALKSQFLILSVLVLALASLFLGGPPAQETAPIGAALPAAAFWIAFAVFFPAVTGIEAGLGMSGDLKDPARSLPLGTLVAVAVGYAVYLAIPLFLAQVVGHRELLLEDSLMIVRVARWPEFIVLGILGATLSSAMGALLGAPRTLQSLAQDAVLPRAIGRGYGEANDPRLATVIAFVIALLGVLLGDLNAIAPILSMFFLTSYAVLNLSAGVESLIGGPGWRPSFNVPWWVSMLGFAACVAAMLMIDTGATFVALFVAGLVYHAVQRRQLRARWGDVRYGALVLAARLILEALARRRPDVRSWNPNILLLTGAPSARWHLVVMARALAGTSGFLTVATVVPDSEAGDRVDALRRAIQEYLAGQRVPALVKVESDEQVADGLIALVKSYGFGPLVPNTVLLGQAQTPADPLKHAELLAVIQRRRRNLIILHEGEDLPAVERARRIDIWWRGHRGNLGLMLALAFLMKKDDVWSDAETVVWRVVESEDEILPSASQLETLLDDARFEARVQVVAHDGDVFSTIRRHSRQADLLFLGLRPKRADERLDEYATYYAALSQQTEGLPPTALVNAGEEVDLHRLFAGV
jgi:solute carrier family 12 (sodium/potassium/chloride transporter), member 2